MRLFTMIKLHNIVIHVDSFILVLLAILRSKVTIIAGKYVHFSVILA
jgi:hypothetical protein